LISFTSDVRSIIPSRRRKGSLPLGSGGGFVFPLDDGGEEDEEEEAQRRRKRRGEEVVLLLGGSK
jgi:hypothetical protein